MKLDLSAQVLARVSNSQQPKTGSTDDTDDDTKERKREQQRRNKMMGSGMMGCKQTRTN
jgi:hypothetical protein